MVQNIIAYENETSPTVDAQVTGEKVDFFIYRLCLAYNLPMRLVVILDWVVLDERIPRTLKNFRPESFVLIRAFELSAISVLLDTQSQVASSLLESI